MWRTCEQEENGLEGLKDGTPCLGNSFSAAGCVCVCQRGNIY